MLPRAIGPGRLRLFALLVGIGAGQAAAAVGVALLVERGFDTFVTASLTPLSRQGATLVAGLLLGVLVAALLRRAERVVAERVGQHYVLQVRDQLFRHLTRVPSRDLGRKHRGSMLLKFVGDLNALRQWVSLGLARLLVAGVALTGALTAMVVINVALGVAIAVVLLCGAAAVAGVAPALLRTTREARRRRARLTGEVTERLSHVGVLQAAGQERRERRRVRRRSELVADAMVDRARASGTTRAVTEGTAVLATVVALVVGAAEVARGAASPGTVVAAMSIAGLLSGYLRDLGRVAEYAAGATVARAAVARFLAMESMPTEPDLPDLEADVGEVELEDVSLGDALTSVTLRAPAGAVVAVVGPNGAGKSTLVSVLARLVAPDSGAVRIDGQDLARCNLASVRRAVGVASPDLPLLRGSMSRNVRYRLPKADDETVARVSALCELEVVAATLPDGWRSDVGETGTKLSTGQRARLLLARAALGEPAVLVLDEAEAHLDLHAAGIVDRVVGDRRARTTVVVTHRRELVERADVVWSLADGRVVEVGAPEELLSGDGPTARLLRGEGPATASVDLVVHR